MSIAFIELINPGEEPSVGCAAIKLEGTYLLRRHPMFHPPRDAEAYNRAINPRSLFLLAPWNDPNRCMVYSCGHL